MKNSTSAKKALIGHLRAHSVRTDGPFTLRSGAVSSWYIDARQTTFSGEGARAVGAAMLEQIDDDVDAVGGMTMGADPIAVATAIAAAEAGRTIRSFSVRKEAKAHGVGGRLVGPVGAGDRVVALEDTTTTGSALVEAIDAMIGAGVRVVKAVALVDRSGTQARERVQERGVPYVALVTPADLGMED
ncbi:MAG: orotate phosphoribosyltransferase [Acidimicrobiia bacterium]|nr:orotate phosphoribosyltransferase [Acidimicrobiia bacterium]